MPSSRSTSSPARFEYSIKAVKETRFLLNSLQQLQVESIEVFYGITISTIRGMLVTRLMGSDYTRMFVPIFHPSEIRELFLRQ